VSDDRLARLRNVVTRLTPAQLRTFASSLDDPDDVALLEEVVGEMASEAERSADARVHWRADPARMAEHLDPNFVRYRYVQLLADRFVDAINGHRPRQLWSLPGRYGKTTILQHGLAWALDRSPDGRSIFVSYGDELAMETGAFVRDLLATHPGELRAQLRKDRKARDRWLTPEGGGLLAAGIRTGITGYGASPGGALIIDDPFKGWQEAHRASERDDVAGRFKGTLRNRLDKESVPIIVVHHRLHVDDLIGRLQAEAEDGTGEEWDLLSLPAIAPPGRPDPLKRKPGEVIEPKRFSLSDVLGRARGLGSSYLVSALEQQEPQPPEGKEILREWFVLASSSELPRTPEKAITSWDLKLKDREAGDWVVGQAWWRVSGGYWVMDQLRGQYDHATTANAIALLAVRNPECHTHVVEAAGSHDEVLPQLRKAQDGYVVSDSMAERLGMSVEEREAVAKLRRRGMAGLVPNPPRGDKSVRARAFIAPNAEPGHVRLPADAPWVPALLDELAGFPDAAHDDQVDAMSQALQRLAKPAAAAGAASSSPTAPRVPTRASAVAGSGAGASGGGGAGNGSGRGGGRVAVVLPGVRRR
jgi:predicted phage terminase large subunit-like protein